MREKSPACQGFSVAMGFIVSRCGKLQYSHLMSRYDLIAEFTTEARRYCTFVEEEGPVNSWVFASTCQHHLLRLYQLALSMPMLEPEIATTSEGMEHEVWRRQFLLIGRKLSRDHYWAVLEPLERDQPEPMMNSLADDLADIWRDLKPVLIALDRAQPISTEEAAWHWRFSFETHWSHHAAGAIVALNALCFGPLADPNRPRTSTRL